MKPQKMVKLKNLGNSFMTITGGYVEKNATVSVREWEAKILLGTQNVIEVKKEK